MTPSELIDIVIQDYDSVDPSDSDNALLRAKYLRMLQHIYDMVWSKREWEWTYQDGTVTFAAGLNHAALPTDFLNLGSQGVLTDPSGIEMKRLPQCQIVRLRRYGSLSHVYAIWDNEVQLPFSVTSNSSYSLHYRYKVTLADDATEMGIQSPYDMTVLLPGLVYRSQGKKNDDRAVWLEQFNAGLSQMCADQNPGLNEVVRMPLAVRGGW